MNLSLPDFIAEIGDERAAELFDVTVRTAQSWRRRERYPRPIQARLIVARSDGRVDYAGIFGEDPIRSSAEEAA